MTHAWCSDTERDAAVRAAEDGRTGPLTTLGEAIVLAFGFDKASAQRACDEVNSWPDDMQAHCRFVLGDLLEQGVERVQALVEAWRYGKGLMAARYPDMIPKSVSASSGVEHENRGDGMATNGLRTERVVLEVTIRQDDTELFQGYDTLAQGVASYIRGELRRGLGESVRVVEETHFDDLAQVAMERDALIREHAEHSSALREMWRLSREACYERAAERDAAIREREELRGERDRANDKHQSYRKTALARVAELESQLESVACRAATAETALGEIKSLDYTRAAVNGAAWQAHNIAANALQAATGGNCSAQPNGSQAASGGGEGDGTFFGAGGPFNFQYAEDSFFPPNVHGFLRQCVKIKEAPPQPRGWLTEEEREMLAWVSNLDLPAYLPSAQEAAKVAKSLLARSSPPEVVLPDWVMMCVSHDRQNQLRKALAAAGVAVKEVS